MNQFSKILAFAMLLALPLGVRAQGETDAQTGRRIFAEIGSGFQAIRRGPQRQYYVLVTPGRAVLVFDSTGMKLGQVPAKPDGPGAIVFGTGLDVDQSGHLYVADRGGNAVNVYGADGSLLAHVRVPAPMSVAALPGDTFAVSDTSSDTLFAVYDFHGVRLRTFGELINLVDATVLNRRLNLGYLASDNAGNLYFAFQYLPEPTVRKYDSSGYLVDEMSLDEPTELQSATQAAQREIARAKKGAAISPLEIISAMGVDPESQEIWLALGDTLVHFDREGHTLEDGPIYALPRARMAPSFVLVEADRLLLGNDPLGIYEFARTNSKVPSK